MSSVLFSAKKGGRVTDAVGKGGKRKTAKKGSRENVVANSTAGRKGTKYERKNPHHSKGRRLFLSVTARRGQEKSKARGGGGTVGDYAEGAPFDGGLRKPEPARNREKRKTSLPRMGNP